MQLLSMRKWHRWLGWTLGWLMLIWFLSGAVLMYAHPSGRFRSAEGRLAGAPALDAQAIKVSLDRAWAAIGSPKRLAQTHLGQVAGRPAYFFLTPKGNQVVWADNGQVLEKVDRELAAASAGQALGGAAQPSHQGLVDVDQWTVTIHPRAGLGPYHKFTADDGRGSELYVSAKTGEVCQQTTGGQRLWSWLGAIPHLLLFTILRQHMEVWRWSLIALAALGCLLGFSGLWLGIRYFRLSGYGKGKHRRYSAFMGMRKWHHYLGLAFGLPALAWCFSGLMLLNPFDWSTPPRPDRKMAMAWSGGPCQPGQYKLLAAEAVAGLHRAGFPVRMLNLFNFQGRPYYLALDGRGGSRLLPAWEEQARVLPSLPPAELAAAARNLLPGHKPVSTELLDRGGLYLPKWKKPVFKVVFDDPDQTWLFIDPARAQITGRLDHSGRVSRWIARFLHTLDLPWLYERPFLREGLMLFLLTGGFLMCLSGIWAWLARKRR